MKRNDIAIIKNINDIIIVMHYYNHHYINKVTTGKQCVTHHNPSKVKHNIIRNKLHWRPLTFINLKSERKEYEAIVKFLLHLFF